MKSSLAAALRWLVLPWGATSGDRIVLDSDDGSIKVYEGSTLVAEMGFAVGPLNNEPGFITWSRTGTGYYGLLTESSVQLGNNNAQGGLGPDVPAYMEVEYGPGLAEPSTLRLGSGFIGPDDFASALVELVSGGSAARPRPTVTLTGSGVGPTELCDLAVTGDIESAGLPVPVQQAGVELVSFVALSSTTVAVAFAQPFPVAPVVQTGIASGAGNTARWDSRAINVTTTGFTLFVYEGDAADPAQTWANVPVHWTATAPTQ